MYNCTLCNPLFNTYNEILWRENAWGAVDTTMLQNCITWITINGQKINWKCCWYWNYYWDFYRVRIRFGHCAKHNPSAFSSNRTSLKHLISWEIQCEELYYKSRYYSIANTLYRLRDIFGISYICQLNIFTNFQVFWLSKFKNLRFQTNFVANMKSKFD